jgi:peptidyl-dipeptidase A
MRQVFNFLFIAIVLLGLAVLTAFNYTKSDDKNTEEMLKEFITKFENKIKPLSKQMAIAYYNASISGNKNDYLKAADAELELKRIFSNKIDFRELSLIKKREDEINDETLKRQLNLIYNTYNEYNINEDDLSRMVEMSNQIEQTFSIFRASFDGNEYTDNEIETILKTSTDEKRLKSAWMSSKEIGGLVHQDIISLVHLRNKIAKDKGFKNYHEMSLILSEQDPENISLIFDHLNSLTKDAYIQLKQEIDAALSEKLGIPEDDLMPWHYQNRFFQEAPKIYDVDLDKYYKEKNLVELTEKYYKSIGLEINDIVKRSDLYEKPGKNQHAYCIDIDNEGDVRVLCNVKDNYYWMNTLLHEFGHGVYDKYIDKKMPYVLREPAHTFTTEAIAMLFGRLAASSQWIDDVIGIDDKEKEEIAEASHKMLRLEQLVFSRWAQVMYRFEKSMYENPDQDLNKLWWNLVEEYQMIKSPDNPEAHDWASKIHIATSPCYYHNYLLGELLASQIHIYITENIMNQTNIRNPSYYGNAEVGTFLKEKVFEPGAKMKWDMMIQEAVGEVLSPNAYARQFIE